MMVTINRLINRIPAIRKTPTDKRAMICSAMGPGRLIGFAYHGAHRLVEPFCLGEITPVDGDSLLCYQVGGHSEFGEPVGWKLFRVSEITGLYLSQEHCQPNTPDSKPENYLWSIIHCCAPGNTVKKPQPGGSSLIIEHERKTPGDGYEKQPKATSFPLTHNELMRKFRRSHFLFPRKMKS